jgi:hypothetical protein
MMTDKNEYHVCHYSAYCPMCEVDELKAKLCTASNTIGMQEACIGKLETALDDHLHEALYQKQVKELQERIAELEKTIELSGTISNYAQETIESAQRKRIAELEEALQQIRDGQLARQDAEYLAEAELQEDDK